MGQSQWGGGAAILVVGVLLGRLSAPGAPTGAVGRSGGGLLDDGDGGASSSVGRPTYVARGGNGGAGTQGNGVPDAADIARGASVSSHRNALDSSSDTPGPQQRAPVCASARLGNLIPRLHHFACKLRLNGLPPCPCRVQH